MPKGNKSVCWGNRFAFFAAWWKNWQWNRGNSLDGWLSSNLEIKNRRTWGMFCSNLELIRAGRKINQTFAHIDCWQEGWNQTT